ncbi:MAG: hypothetical protein V1744_07160 [Candidatus Altiarchaeota archaeon]
MGLFDFLRGWKPRKRTVYGSWVLTSRTFVVEVIIDGVKYDGTFSVRDDWCEIRTPKVNMVLPRKNVIFSKSIEPSSKAGEYGGPGELVTYTAKVIRHSHEDVRRFEKRRG